MRKEIGIILKMESLLGEMSAAEQKVISYIIENPEKVIHLSVAGLAENCDSSEASVIRACRKLDLNGYQHLKVVLAQSLVSPIQSINHEIDDNDSPWTIISKVFESTSHALNYTKDVLDFNMVEQAAKLIATANKVIIFGLGNSHSAVIDMQHKLSRLGINAIGVTDSHLQVIIAASSLPGDVAVGISHSGSSIDVVESIRTCKDNGAKIITMSSFGKSPLTKLSDVVLATASKETEYMVLAMSSRIVQLVIIDCLYTLIAMEDKERLFPHFNEIEEGMGRKKY